MREKKERRLAARVRPLTEEAREVLKLGPAEPTRMKRTMSWGNQAKLTKRQY
jgi:hypothetical protein